MRSKIFALLAISFLIFTFTMSASSAAEYSLSKAILWDYVDMDISSTGNGHAGFCLDLELSNNRSDTITVVVEAGTILTPAKSGYQKMILGETRSIYLGAYQIKRERLYGFCGDFYAKPPTKGLGFSHPTISTSTDLKKVIKAIKSVRTEIERKYKYKSKKTREEALSAFDNIAQIAIWVVTNNLNRTKLTEWLVKEKSVPIAKAELQVEAMQPIVNLLLATAGVKKRF